MSRQNITKIANAGAKGLSNLGAILQRAGNTVKVSSCPTGQS